MATLKPLGSGYAIVDLGSRKAIQSLPLELSPDGSRLLALGEQQGYVAFGSTAALGWRPDRFQRAVVDGSDAERRILIVHVGWTNPGRIGLARHAKPGRGAVLVSLLLSLF